MHDPHTERWVEPDHGYFPPAHDPPRNGQRITNEFLAKRYSLCHLRWCDRGHIDLHELCVQFAVERIASPHDVLIFQGHSTDRPTGGQRTGALSVAHGSNLTYTISVTSKGPDFGYDVRIKDTLPAGTTFVSYDAGGGACIAPTPGSPGTLNCTLPQLNKGATWNVKCTVKVNATAGTALSNTAATISSMQDFVPANNVGTITTRVNAPTI
jgi:uncharacterized repeat protein (TIGR01451 family)